MISAGTCRGVYVRGTKTPRGVIGPFIGRACEVRVCARNAKKLSCCCALENERVIWMRKRRTNVHRKTQAHHLCNACIWDRFAFVPNDVM